MLAPTLETGLCIAMIVVGQETGGNENPSHQQCLGFFLINDDGPPAIMVIV